MVPSASRPLRRTALCVRQVRPALLPTRPALTARQDPRGQEDSFHLIDRSTTQQETAEGREGREEPRCEVGLCREILRHPNAHAGAGVEDEKERQDTYNDKGNLHTTTRSQKRREVRGVVPRLREAAARRLRSSILLCSLFFSSLLTLSLTPVLAPSPVVLAAAAASSPCTRSLTSIPLATLYLTYVRTHPPACLPACCAFHTYTHARRPECNLCCAALSERTSVLFRSGRERIRTRRRRSKMKATTGATLEFILV